MKPIYLSLLLILSPVCTAAQSYPDREDPYVSDFADLLTPEQEDAIRAKLFELRTARDIEFTVVTVGMLSDYNHSGAIEPFATGLFNVWGVGAVGRNDGLMMLVALRPRPADRGRVGLWQQPGRRDEGHHRNRHPPAFSQ